MSAMAEAEEEATERTEEPLGMVQEAEAVLSEAQAEQEAEARAERFVMPPEG